ncbi:hypothetical protein HW555_012038 [Spodoptera exigua]|uniref:Uncharacterized protein n=1 Tax=Spodoptera exigua TaxID=7107 RepID=A0A835G8A6_SPOEX|nr:hypothetical protein HW555_012038 [Spodoptera exigua]
MTTSVIHLILSVPPSGQDFVKMEYDALILGLIIYLLLVGILIIINEAFCKARCMKNAQILQMEREMRDVELNERQPTKIDREPILQQPIKTSHHQRFQ